MRFLYAFCWMCLGTISLIAQNNPKPYFQQALSYEIKARLDDQNHQLKGDWKLQYTNHSPDSLTFIYMHLYPNAYKNNRTALGKQMTADGKLDWYFAAQKERGFLKDLDFKTASGASLRWEYHERQLDIAKIYLPKALAPKQSIEISTAFLLQIPKSVSRLGHSDQSYQMTQWYPKPAVYDNKGWHPMPYLDQGEFFSEFGDFRVELTLPANYVVGGTGELETAAERRFLNRKAAETAKLDLDSVSKQADVFPTSSDSFKTIIYTAQKVHDFAWFADKRFNVLKDSLELASGKKVKVWAMFPNSEAHLWKDATLYLRQAVAFYSEKVGEYPYSHATAVHSSLGAGGGMEYPMITVIGNNTNPKDLDVVIMHEVGHNWFYGILASNERDHAWMDEGLNSYIESRYIDKYYTDANQRQQLLVYWYQAARGVEQPICTHSAEFTGNNYYLGAYAKPTLLFRHLEKYVGTARLDKAMQAYYNTWKFRHPYPEDLQAIFEQELGESLDWFFVDWMQTTKKIDYAVKKTSYENGKFTVKIRNEGELNIPMSISAILDTQSRDTVLKLSEKIQQTVWIKGLAPKQDTTLVFEAAPDAYFQLDAFENVPDFKPINDNNRDRLKVKLALDFKFPEKKRINLLPILGKNQYDGFMLGLAVYNLPVPMRKLEYLIAPMFGFKSKMPVGYADVQYHFWTNQNKPKKSHLQRITIGAGVRTFSNNYNKTYKYFTEYARLNVFAEAEFKKPTGRGKLKNTLRLDNFLITETSPNFERVPADSLNPAYFKYTGKNRSWRSTHRLTHTLSDSRNLNPYSIQSCLEFAQYKDNEQQMYLKLSVEGNFKLQYTAHAAAYIRAFAGGFLMNTDSRFGAFPLQLAARNQNDYQYDELFTGRNEQTGSNSQQIRIAEGGFKTVLPQSTFDGHSNKFIAAVNLKSDLPIRLPFGQKWARLRPYLDLGYFANSEPSVQIQSFGETFFYNGGLSFELFGGALALHLPLVGNKDLMNALRSRGNIWTRISVSANTKLINVRKITQHIEF